ncbi:hypothetical protein A1O7_08568 [Cladophialophora yegresii CBS 114405]|uniref:C3H1-type domain-containing protein n=1 Tax=Cladophialophora yegresii CBS 114405 TaxID=1182544 RepID=W9WAQ1_9EURO|nr:uncharacterized protein A1O7_08568 [Cladophialophora yegresii CBS 114405]EXJ55639.1 hypothetical protein A1O7_08568 [Cladophialophora yegresii CBS 114405]
MARYDPFSPTFDHPLMNSSPDYASRNGSFRSSRAIGDLGAITGQISFRERHKRLRNLEEDKNQLIEDLMYQLETAQNQFDRLQLDHSRETQYNREGQLREQALRDQLSAVKLVMDRNSFISVLLDGDNMVFTKELLSRGEDGGKEAANMIFDNVTAFIAEHLHHLDSPKIVTKIYANFKTLSEHLAKLKVVEKQAVFDEFVRGMNSAQLLLDFVDAGTQPESTREKVTDQFKVSLYDCHCHQVILGCSSNRQYTRLLEETIKDPYVSNHITLLEAAPLDRDLAIFKETLKTTKFENVFRTTKLAAAPAMPKGPLQAVTATLPALARVESNGTTGTASSSSTPAVTWALLTAQPTPPASKPPSTTRTSTPNSLKSPDAAPPATKPSTRTIDRNRHGQRIDKVDNSIPNHEIQRIKKLKLCNIFYLQGSSYCTTNNCSHSHTYPLSKAERNVLREVARMTPCYYKMDCSDPECIYGHRCPQNKPDENGCWYGEDCRFYGWGHAIDTRVVKTTKV